MAFNRITAPRGVGAEAALSADKPRADRYALLDILRAAGPALGLKPPVIATLGALLSCLPPKPAHHVVFASNDTLSLRRDGISDRTLRRHFAVLEDVGLLLRHDSPNRKRYTRRDPETGESLRFGFDLGPLFRRATELGALAARVARAEEHLRFLRLRLRVAISRALRRDPEDPVAREIQPMLRRRLSAECVEAQLARLPASGFALLDTRAGHPCDEARPSGTDGRNVRHHHRSTKEFLDNDTIGQTSETVEQDPAVQAGLLLTECPAALEFAVEPIESPRDIMRHASMLAPMMGIDPRRYAEAERGRGAWATAATVWIILSLKSPPRHSGRYFESLMNGIHRGSFDPWRYLTLRSQGKGGCSRLSADNSPPAGGPDATGVARSTSNRSGRQGYPAPRRELSADNECSAAPTRRRFPTDQSYFRETPGHSCDRGAVR